MATMCKFFIRHEIIWNEKKFYLKMDRCVQVRPFFYLLIACVSQTSIVCVCVWRDTESFSRCWKTFEMLGNYQTKECRSTSRFQEKSSQLDIYLAKWKSLGNWTQETFPSEHGNCVLLYAFNLILLFSKNVFFLSSLICSRD